MNDSTHSEMTRGKTGTKTGRRRPTCFSAGAHKKKIKHKVSQHLQGAATRNCSPSSSCGRSSKIVRRLYLSFVRGPYDSLRGDGAPTASKASIVSPSVASIGPSHEASIATSSDDAFVSGELYCLNRPTAKGCKKLKICR